MPSARSLHGSLFLAAQQWQRVDFVQFGGWQTLLVRGVSPHGQALATTPAVAVTARPGNTGCAPPFPLPIVPPGSMSPGTQTAAVFPLSPSAQQLLLAVLSPVGLPVYL